MNYRFQNPILPTKHTYAKIHNTDNELNLEAICAFIATGFFLDDDTYFKDRVCLRPSYVHEMDSNGYLIESKPWFKWFYEPRDISFPQALQEYIELLNVIFKDQLGNSQVLLPISGGLDSRSQALILKNMDNNVHAFSYSFEGGYQESEIAERIAKECGFSFQAYKISQSYLWEEIDKLAQINGCYSEFTNPRQMAIIKHLSNFEGKLSLGHWGDVLFDRGAPSDILEDTLLPYVFKKTIKPKGLELASELWKIWGLEGNFYDYIVGRIEKSLDQINIDNVSAKARAFKTMQWAHRWTTTNLSIFDEAKPIALPYYDDRMIQFICSIPEDYLAGRRLQLAHIETDNKLSSIVWQDSRPFSINNRNWNRTPFNLPYRIKNKFLRQINSILGKPYIQRNWELQFLGVENDSKLRDYLFNPEFNKWIPKNLVNKMYKNFKTKDAIYYSHSISMLLTLSVWWNKNHSNIND